MSIVPRSDGSLIPVAPDMTLRELRRLWDEHTGLTSEINQNAKIVWYRYGGGGILPKWAAITLPGPNFKGRRVWVDQHDFHHVLTGYPVNWGGEALICAWELAAYGNLGWNFYAWWCLLHGILWGLLTRPRETILAWKRGRHGKTLFDTPYDDALLDKTVGQVRRELGIDWMDQGGAPPGLQPAGMAANPQ